MSHRNAHQARGAKRFEPREITAPQNNRDTDAVSAAYGKGRTFP
jgi:hypothetical protein